MTDDRQIILSPDGQSVIVENGPMRLAIKAFSHGVFQTDAALEAARFSFTCLEQVAHCLPHLKRYDAVLPEDSPHSIARRMIRSVRETGDTHLTPMAAVAGSIADAVAERLYFRSVTKVIVDNGGDIAIRTTRDKSVKIGLRTDLMTPRISHIIELSGQETRWGVNTSGLGGRSFTRGIASAATAFGKTSSQADAAATSIANACYHPHKNIVQIPAGQIDPNTDIPDIPVTVRVGELSCETFRAAVKHALKKAETYVSEGLIRGAVIAAGPYMATTRRFTETVGLIRSQPGCNLMEI